MDYIEKNIDDIVETWVDTYNLEGHVDNERQENLVNRLAALFRDLSE